MTAASRKARQTDARQTDQPFAGLHLTKPDVSPGLCACLGCGDPLDRQGNCCNGIKCQVAKARTLYNKIRHGYLQPLMLSFKLRHDQNWFQILGNQTLSGKAFQMANARNLQMISWRKRNISLLIFLSIILLACHPGCSSYLSVDRVTIVDEIPYLHATLETDEHCYSREDHYFMSNNNGRNWKEIAVPPVAMQPITNPPEEVQVTVCVPNQTHTCYRISGKEKVETSTDGGLTWKTDWKMPPGRESYMARDNTIRRRDGVDTIPKDMGIAVRKAGHLVIVAMGNQGVLIKSTDGTWMRYPVATQHKLYERYDQAYPPPFFASSIS